MGGRGGGAASEMGGVAWVENKGAELAIAADEWGSATDAALTATQAELAGSPPCPSPLWALLLLPLGSPYTMPQACLPHICQQRAFFLPKFLSGKLLPTERVCQAKCCRQKYFPTDKSMLTDRLTVVFVLYRQTIFPDR